MYKKAAGHLIGGWGGGRGCGTHVPSLRSAADKDTMAHPLVVLIDWVQLNYHRAQYIMGPKGVS